MATPIDPASHSRQGNADNPDPDAARDESVEHPIVQQPRTQIAADMDVQRFGFVSDASGNRFVFPRAQAVKIDGIAGTTRYGAAQCICTALEGRLDALRWKAESVRVETAWLRDESGRYEMVADRIDHPGGLMLVRGADHVHGSRIEILAPEASLHELRFTYKGPFERKSSVQPPAASPTLRQTKLGFLDGLSGHVVATVKVRLDVPVLGERTLDQELRVPIQDGAIDFKALDDSLHWLGGAFLDIAHEADQLKLRWKVPIVGPSHDLLTWPLDPAASTLAAFGRVPVRSLTEPHVAQTGTSTEAAADKKDKRKILSAIALDGIDVALSLATAGHIELEPGLIAFGDNPQSPRVSATLSGAIGDQGAGALKGAISHIDTTIKDLRLGPIEITADRLCFDGPLELEVAFDGFRPTCITAVIHRATATNLSIQIRTSNDRD